VNHMVTMARSKKLTGPYESHPRNPVLTNANTTSLCETDHPLNILGGYSLVT
jgi:beta-xylosidase